MCQYVDEALRLNNSVISVSLQARPSRTGFRESSDVQHYVLTLTAVPRTEMCTVEVARSTLLTITKSQLGQIFGQHS